MESVSGGRGGGIAPGSAALAEGGDLLLELLRDGLRIGTGFEADGRPDAHADLIRRGEFASRLFDFEETVDAHGEHWNMELVGEQADTRAKGEQVAVFGVLAFGEDENAVTLIDTFACVGEAFLKSRGAW